MKNVAADSGENPRRLHREGQICTGRPLVGGNFVMRSASPEWAGGVGGRERGAGVNGSAPGQRTAAPQLGADTMDESVCGGVKLEEDSWGREVRGGVASGSKVRCSCSCSPARAVLCRRNHIPSVPVFPWRQQRQLGPSPLGRDR